MLSPSRALGFLALALILPACNRTQARPVATDSAAAAADTGAARFRGMVLETPIPKPDFTLTDTDGKPFSFAAGTQGYVTLLFFGYTHCPDVCPVHMANIGAVLKQLPATDASRVKVVFVSVDPERDTPNRIRTWLDGFNPAFIGLTGTAEQLAAAQAAAKLPGALRDPPDTTKGPVSGYTVSHAAFVIAYTADGLGRVLYPFGTRQSDWALAIPQLVKVGS